MIKVKLKSGESLSSNNNYCELDYDVWVSLCQGKTTEIKEVNKGIALNKILPDAWISNNMEHAKNFINWVRETTFYDLTYNDNEEIVKMINKII